MHAYTLLHDKDLSHRILMPIIIDKTTSNMRDEVEDDKESMFDFECATVLYNYGLLYSLSSTTANSNQSSENNSLMFQQSALCIQELAAAVLLD
jgi:hypothetical protein